MTFLAKFICALHSSAVAYMHIICYLRLIIDRSEILWKVKYRMQEAFANLRQL